MICLFFYKEKQSVCFQDVPAWQGCSVEALELLSAVFKLETAACQKAFPCCKLSLLLCQAGCCLQPPPKWALPSRVCLEIRVQQSAEADGWHELWGGWDRDSRLPSGKVSSFHVGGGSRQMGPVYGQGFSTPCSRSQPLEMVVCLSSNTGNGDWFNILGSPGAKCSGALGPSPAPPHLSSSLPAVYPKTR